MGAYLASIGDLGRGRLAFVCLLVAAGTLVEGFGIVLLVPLLGLVFAGQGGGNSALERMLGDALSGYPHAAQLGLLLTVFAAILILRAAILWQRDLRLGSLSYEVVDRWRERQVRAMASASWRRLQEMQISHLEFAVTSEVTRLAIGSDRLLRGALGLVQLVIQLGVAIALAPMLTLIAIGLALLALALVLPLARAAYRHGEDLSRDGRKRQNALGEFLSGMKLAKAHDAEDRYAGEFIAVSDDMRGRIMRFTDMQLRGQHGFQLAGGLVATIIVVLALEVTGTRPVVLSALLVLLARTLGPAQQLVQGAQSLLSMLPAVGSLIAIEQSLGGDIPAAAPVQPTAVVKDSGGKGPAGIAFRDISFSPAGREQQLLRDVSGTIAPGDFALLLGPSGSGKTTLADMLIGLVEPAARTLLVDGQPIVDEAGRAAWRRQLGYVPQDPFLFDATLRENLAWAEPDADEARLWRALEMAEAADFVRSLPEGLETRVGDRGSRLSGGERQRICLARTLLREPRLLVLDEATNALDREVEDRLLATLDRLRGTVTILMITHRLPEGFRPDRILRLAGGSLTVELARPALASG